MRMRVLVTGATGLIGRGAVAALRGRGHDVVAVVRPGREPSPGATAIEHDLLERVDARSLPEADVVLHLAHHPHVTFPEHATKLYRLNASATLELLDAARSLGVTRFVHASTGGVYGYASHPLREDDPPRATDFYALTKLHAEALVRLYGEYFSTTILRPFFPYGPGQRDRLIPRLARSIEQGEPVLVDDDGGPRLNPIYVDDAVAAFVAAVEGGTEQLLNVAGEEVVTVRGLAETIGGLLRSEPRFQPRARDGGDLVADISRLRAVLDAGRFVGLQDGLRRTLAVS